MTEYIIIVALIAIGAIGVVSLFGDNIRTLFGTVDDALAGDESAEAGTLQSTPKFAGHKGFKNFAERNSRTK
jgi:Flp pilus assembly pilin Flp